MNAIFVIGLGFGDEGKGSIVDSLTRTTEAKTVVRYNGGAQAAHHVVTAEGHEHCFSQFGAGTLAGARTHLSRFMMINPLAMRNEVKHLDELGINNPLSLVTIDPHAPIITPYHKCLNRLREMARGAGRHGSCGQGVGELGSDLATGRPVLTAAHLWGDKTGEALDLSEMIRVRCAEEAVNLSAVKLTSQFMREVGSTDAQLLFDGLYSPPNQWLKEAQALKLTLSSTFDTSSTVIFEGAQGVLLDEWYGFHPHTTWSNCTFDNALQLCGEMGGVLADIQRIGVTRAYQTRHGAGPFPTEYAALRVALSKSESNHADPWQGEFRPGHLDLSLLQYALDVCPVDSLSVTCVDHIAQRGHWSAGVGYASLTLRHEVQHDLARQEAFGKQLENISVLYQHGTNVEDLLHLIESRMRTPIKIVSYGPTAEDKEGAYINA